MQNVQAVSPIRHGPLTKFILTQWLEEDTHYKEEMRLEECELNLFKFYKS